MFGLDGHHFHVTKEGRRMCLTFIVDEIGALYSIIGKEIKGNSININRIRMQHKSTVISQNNYSQSGG